MGELERELAVERENHERSEQAAKDAEEQYTHLMSEYESISHTFEEIKSSLQVSLFLKHIETCTLITQHLVVNSFKNQ